ncbi:MAG: SpoIID/LytB domain protein, partial [Massilibacillus sp.]|nr:SpoIID/LytB domain protein [Massilibacillus sp.]
MIGMFMVAFTGCDLNQSPMKEQQENKSNDNTQLIEPTLSVYMHETGETKQMKLEEYLAGVVAGEMKNDWQVEALAAQAIMARTFTLQALEKGQLTKEGTNASTDIKEFQAYNASAINDNIRNAVQMTRGKVVTYQSTPIMGWFNASAGGQTAMAKEGLDYKEEDPPFIQSVSSPDDMAPADVQSWMA